MSETTKPKDNLVQVAALSKRGLESRQRIKDAVRTVLNEKGYSGVQVRDIAKVSGVAHGLFYRYFPDTKTATREVLDDFLTNMNVALEEMPAYEDFFDYVYNYHLIIVRFFSGNRGIIGAFFQTAGQHPEFDDIWQSATRVGNLTMGREIERFLKYDEKVAREWGFVLGAVTEGILYQYYIRRIEEVSGLVETPEDIAEMIAVIWHRVLTLKLPPDRPWKNPEFLMTPGR